MAITYLNSFKEFVAAGQGIMLFMVITVGLLLVIEWFEVPTTLSYTFPSHCTYIVLLNMSSSAVSILLFLLLLFDEKKLSSEMLNNAKQSNVILCLRMNC